MGDDSAWAPELLARATRRQILVRMLLNLKRLYVKWRSFPQARLITDLLLALSPSAVTELRDRGLLAYHMNDFPAALRDLEEYLKLSKMSEADDDAKKDNQQVWEHVKALRRRVASLN
jgi:regulator of sirC expression with transglutaminase-like and TPR domain